MADALALDADPSVTETQIIVHMYNRFFDVLNVKSLKELLVHKKQDVLPHRHPQDERLKVYQNWSYSPPLLSLPPSFSP